MAKLLVRGFYVDLLFPVAGILLALLSGVQSEALDVTKCDAYVKRTNGVVCYSSVGFTDSWQVAQKFCQARSETLIEILTLEENEAVRNLLINKNIVDSWLGAVQSKVTWRWLDGVELSDQGCFVDDLQNPDMEFVANFSSENTIDKCISFCRSQFYLYAGVEAGQLCRCGMLFGRYGQKDAVCGSICPGNNSQTCGGTSSQQIFSVDGVYSNWLRGQPSNNDEYQTCATIDSATGYQWQDVYCRDSYKALCEIRPLNGSCSRANVRSIAINGRCLLATEVETNFFRSRYSCRSYGGDLLTYLSAEDTALLAQAFNHSLSAPSVQYYIGLTKWTWQWQTENEFLYTNWKLSNPTGPGFDCITIKRDASPPGEWMTTNCNSTHLYICQKSNSTAQVTAPLFTLPPSTTSRRTPLPPLPRTSLTSRSPDGTTPTSLYPSEPSTASHTNQANTAAIIGGAVAGGVGFIILVVIITICVIICQRNREAKAHPQKTDATSDDSKVDPLPPTYFFGIETTPKYRNEKPAYPALPDFGEGKTAKNTTEERNKSQWTWSSSSPDVHVYTSLTLTPTESSASAATRYSDDIFINPELSY